MSSLAATARPWPKPGASSAHARGDREPGPRDGNW